MDDYRAAQNMNQNANQNGNQGGNPNTNQAVNQSALEIAETAEKVIQTAAENSAQANSNGNGSGNGDIKGSDSSSNPSDAFVGLPIESLICGPIVAAAKGQQELSAVYIDTLMKLAYENTDSGKNDTGTDATKAKTLDFTLERPVIEESGAMSTQQVQISAPLLSLVPIPAFTMSELTVDFNMEVKSADMADDKTHSDVQTTVGFNSWFGLKSSITGNVSADSEHKRQTDSSATYTIHARAVQQPPTEGMQKLTSLFTNLMEPIDLSKKSQ